jgi:hypothetical protein
VTAREFKDLLETIAAAWERGDARTANRKIANWREYQHRSDLAGTSSSA